METVEPLTEDDMLMAWVEGEMNSPRYRADYDQLLDRSAPLTPASCRTALARMRGYPDRFIFSGLPSTMEFSRIRVTVGELGSFRYLNYETFCDLSAGTRLVSDGAANVETINVGEQLNERVRQTEAGFAAGDQHAPLIAVSTDQTTTPILLEGNTRATAYVRGRPPDDVIEMILGVSPTLASWTFA